jgi:hypothetical protein
MKLLTGTERKHKRKRIRSEKKISVLKMNTLEGKLMNSRIRWYGHVLRMNKERIPKKVWA